MVRKPDVKAPKATVMHKLKSGLWCNRIPPTLTSLMMMNRVQRAYPAHWRALHAQTVRPEYAISLQDMKVIMSVSNAVLLSYAVEGQYWQIVSLRNLT